MLSFSSFHRHQLSLIIWKDTFALLTERTASLTQGPGWGLERLQLHSANKSKWENNTAPLWLQGSACEGLTWLIILLCRHKSSCIVQGSAACGNGFPGMPPKQRQENGISVCVECVLEDLQRPGYLASEVLPLTHVFSFETGKGKCMKSLKLFMMRELWCSGVLHQGLDSQHHLCLERTKSTLFICPEWTMAAQWNDELPTQQTCKTAPPEKADWSSLLRKQRLWVKRGCEIRSWTQL